MFLFNSVAKQNAMESRNRGREREREQERTDFQEMTLEDLIALKVAERVIGVNLLCQRISNCFGSASVSSQTMSFCRFKQIKVTLKGEQPFFFFFLISSFLAGARCF